MLIVTLVGAHTAPAVEVSVPLRLDVLFLRQSLLQQLFSDPGQTAHVWDDGRDCNALVLSEPQVDVEGERIRVVSRAQASIGVAVAGRCLHLKSWAGTIEVFELPRLDPQLAVVAFDVVDSNVYGAGGSKEVTGTVWDWVKSFVHPRLEAVRVDLQGALAELKSVLPLFLADRDLAAVQRLLDSVALADARVTATGLAVDVRLDVAEAAAGPPAAPAPEPTLTEGELARWEKAWREWDAFLTFVVKRAGADTGTQELRRELAAVLLEARYDLLEALRKTRRAAPDPVRVLFVRAWSRLAPLLRDLCSGLPGETALRYLSFVAAADALTAIDAVGPQLGVEISTDGLRRLARVVAPEVVEDPLTYSLEVDPALRELAGFGLPIPLTSSESVDGQAGWLRLFVSAAWAAPAPPTVATFSLDGWVPKPAEIGRYLPLVHQLLERAVASTPRASGLAASYRDLYRVLVLATAWQESCWRQFIQEGGRVTTLRSAVGSVGIMQVNENVWRGFYDVSALRNDIEYNARAGSEILVHYLIDHAMRKGEHETNGEIDNLARATYSAYNAGPGQLRRYRKVKRGSRAARIDEAFWTKYRAVKAGRERQVSRCFGIELPAE